MIALFHDTVHAINFKDYNTEQLKAWAPEHLALSAWQQSFLHQYCVVVVQDDRIVGFGDVSVRGGYLNRLYTHQDHQREGIATQICEALEDFVGTGVMQVQASITAKPFFEQRGYEVLKEQHVQRSGVLLTNYLMEKVLNEPSKGGLVPMSCWGIGKTCSEGSCCGGYTRKGYNQ